MNNLEITDVQVVLPRNSKVNDKLKGFANIVFNKIFIVKNLRIIEGSKGFFVVMPNFKKKDGSFQDVAHPLNDEFRRTIDDKVLEVYENTLQSQRQINKTT